VSFYIIKEDFFVKTTLALVNMDRGAEQSYNKLVIALNKHKILEKKKLM